MPTPPDFSVGQYNTAAYMNAIGLWRVTTCTVTSAGGTAATASNGVITVGTNNTSVTVSNAFSADYDNYLITYEGGTASAQGSIGLQLGAATTNYYSAGLGYTWAGGASNFTNNPSNFPIVGYVTTTFTNMEVSLFGPFASRRTTMRMNTTSATQQLTGSGYQDSNTSFTAFTLTWGASTVTGGKIRVYGYRN